MWHVHVYYIYKIYLHIYLHNIEFDGSTGLSGSRLFGLAECWEVNNNVNTSRYQDWIRQVSGVIVIDYEILII